MFVESRDQAREFFLRVWGKMATHEACEPLEALVAQIIAAHPEYHNVLADSKRALATDFDDLDRVGNPFLHMGLHIALIEQLQTDRPAGLRDLYQRLLAHELQDKHRVEHGIMECLAKALAQAGDGGTAPDETAYLESVQRLLE